MDPDPGKVMSPITVVNKYVYTGNSPTNFTDPSGRWFWIAVAIGALIGGADASLNGRNVLAGAFMGALAGAAIFFTWQIAATSSMFGLIEPSKWVGFVGSVAPTTYYASSSGGSFVNNFIGRVIQGQTILGAAVSQLNYAAEETIWSAPWNTFSTRVAYTILLSGVFAVGQVPMSNFEESYRNRERPTQ